MLELLCNKLNHLYESDDIRNYVAEFAEWLDHLNLVQKVLSSKYLQTCHIKCEERRFQLSVTSGKRAKGVTRCGHIEIGHQWYLYGLHNLYKEMYFVFNRICVAVFAFAFLQFQATVTPRFYH